MILTIVGFTVKGWTAASHLRAGDILVTVNGEYVAVEKTEHELLEALETTYNFAVFLISDSEYSLIAYYPYCNGQLPNRTFSLSAFC